MTRIVTTFLILAGFALTAAAQTNTTACSAISVGDLGALNGWVPSPNDAWHQDVSGLPVDANSDKIMTTSGDLANRYLHPDFSNVVDGAYGIPYTIIDSTNVPFVPITPYDPDDSDNTLYPITASTPIEGSPGECWTDGNYDHHSLIIDRTTCAAYEIYQADLCAGQWTSYGNVIWDFTLPNGEKRPYGMSSVDAAGLSIFEGLIRYDEIVAGNINHAIRFTALHTKQDRNNGYFTAPATHAAGNLWGTDDIMGMRIRLKPGFDTSTYSQTNRVILNAMKKYGMILADNGSDMFFQGTPDPRWDDSDLSALKAIPSTAFEVVQMNPIYDSESAPAGQAPNISSFTASADNVAPGTAVTLTPLVSAGSYEFVDAAGFTRGPITVAPLVTTTYTLFSRNEYDTATLSVTVNVQDNGSHLAFNPVSTKNYGDAPFGLSVTSLSSGAVTYSLLSGAATISASTVTLTGVGTVTLQASQAAAGAYPATSATTSFSVSGPSPTLTFNTIPNQAFGASPFAVTATSNSSGAITYSAVSGPAALSGNVVTILGAGHVTLMAAQVSAGTFGSGAATTSFDVSGPSTTLAFVPIPTQTVGAVPIRLAVSTASDGLVSFALVNGPALVFGNSATVTGAGTVTIEAIQAASGAYPSATAFVTFDVIEPGTLPSLAFHSIANQTFGAPPFAVSATSNSTGAITYSILSGPATISSNLVTLTGVGTVTLQASQAAAGGYTSATANAFFVVVGTTPTLSFSAVPNQTFGAAPFTVSATSNSTGAITYSVLSGPVTISGSTVTITGAGSVTLQASQAASGGYTSATASTSFNVTATAPNLSFTAIPNQILGGTPFAVSATSNSAGPITYSVLSGPATLSGNILTLTGSATVVLQATQTAAGGYSAATTNTTFYVTGATTTLSFSPIANQTLGAAPFPVSASSDSNAAITYAVLNGPARISGNVVTLTGVGTVTLQASQAATAGYSAATAGTSFVVTGNGPTLTFNQVPNNTFGVAPFAVSASSNSPGAITYTVITGPATLAGNIVTLTGSGTVVLQASQVASGSYIAASVTCSFSIGDASPVLTFNTIANRTFGVTPFAVSATSSSPGAIAYSVVSGPATLVGNLLTLTGGGAVTLQASQPAVSGFTAATTNVSFNVSSVTPNLIFQSIADHAFGAVPFPVSASSTSPGAITYSILSGPAAISGNVITLTAAGTVVLQATQAATSGFASASANASFNVTAVNPAVSFATIANQTFGTAPFTVAATSNSPGAITYSIISGPAILVGNVVTLTGAGAVTLEASQAATAGYAPATALTSFNVSPVSPSLNFNSIAAQNFGAAPFAVVATSNSNGAVTYTVLSGPASIAGNLLTLTGAGTVTLQAFQAATAGYASASAITSFNVTALSPALTFTTISAQSFGASPFPVSATSNSPGAISYSVIGGPATLSGNVVTLTGAGTITLQASQAAAAGYSAATALNSFNVMAISPTLTFNSVANQTFGATPLAVSANSNSTGAITYSVLSGPATVTGNTVALTGIGLVTLQATQTANSGYSPALAVTSFTVNAAVPSLAINNIPTQVFGGSPIAVSATSNSAAATTWSIVSGPAVMVGGTVGFTAAGPVTLQVTQAASGNFLAATTTTTFIVNPAVPTLTITNIPTQTFGAGPLTVSATSNSATPITYNVVSGPATISGTTVTLVGAGGVTLQATQLASGNYLAGSAIVTFTVAPSSVVLAGDFAMPNNITITINQGDSKDVTVPVSAINGFNGLVSFHCAVPAAMTFGVCNTTTAQLTSTNAANATISVSTKGPLQTAAESRTSPLKPATTGLVLLGCLLPCGLPLLRRRKINLRSFGLGLLLVLSMGAMTLTTTGCGAMILNPLTPAGTYVLNVNASSGSSAHAMTITVIVQQPKN